VRSESNLRQNTREVRVTAAEYERSESKLLQNMSEVKANCFRICTRGVSKLLQNTREESKLLQNTKKVRANCCRIRKK
jgi:hypothetical protein